jgi:methyl-accepting chemotaxis protein
VAQRSQRLGLSWTIFGTFTTALVVLVLVLLILVPRQADEYLTGALQKRARAVAKELQREVHAAGKTTFDAEASSAVRTILEGESELGLALVVACSDPACTPLGQRVIARRAGWREDRDDKLLSAYNQSGQHVSFELPGGDLAIADVVSVGSGQPGWFVLLEIKRDAVAEVVGALRTTLLIALLLSVVVFVALVLVVSRWLIVRPIRSMRAQAARLSEADLTGSVNAAGTRELDELADALNNIGQGLRDTLGRVRGVAESVAGVVDQISRTAANTSGGSTTVATRVEETSSAMVEMLASLKGIADNVETLYQSAEESSSSILEMATTNDEVSDNVTKMAAAVEQTTSAIEEMTYSIKEVARNIDELLKSAEVASGSIREMDVAIGQVETNAYETARLSEQVSHDAESGMESIQKTIVGIDKIKEASRSANQAIESLGNRIQEIGNIVDVIDDVAEQTNLLALNAAIIAAQAGDHGRPFAVVAEEIKGLAERTGDSTKEIGDLIRSVQEASRNAVAAMTQGVRNVEEGVLLGREAEDALKKIQDSAGRSTQMVKAIARATVEQAKGSKEVTANVERIRTAVEQISKASNEQAKGSEQIMTSAEHMKVLGTHVQRSVQEQAHGNKQISRSIENINEMVTYLNRAQKEQTRGSEQVLKAIEAIKSVADSQTKSVRQLEEAIETLRRQADVLRGEIRRFRV